MIIEYLYIHIQRHIYIYIWYSMFLNFRYIKNKLVFENLNKLSVLLYFVNYST